jgi:hypothetical protein
MSFIFKINEELAAIAVTATELLSITRALKKLINNTEYFQCFNGIVAEINKSYAVINDCFSPFYTLDGEEEFVRQFDELHESFKSRYLMEVSKPRRYCDNVYDDYIQLQQTREAKSGYPLLKRNFQRLDVFYDKWITNDNLLAMSIDGAVKLQNRLLGEIVEIKQKDAEYAYIVLSSALDDFHDLLTLIKTKSDYVSSNLTL